MAPTLRKYMFDRDFSPQAPPEREQAEEIEEVVEEPPPPSFSEDELNMARDLAFDQGRQQGRAEAEESLAATVVQALETLAGAMDDLAARQHLANEETQRAAIDLAMVVLRKMLPAACRVHAFDEVIGTIEEVIGTILDEPRLIVRVAEPLVAPVRERLEPLALDHGFEGRVVVQAAPRLAAGDCRIEWADGGAERNQARLMADIEARVAQALAPPEHPSPGRAAPGTDAPALGEDAP